MRQGMTNEEQGQRDRSAGPSSRPSRPKPLRVAESLKAQTAESLEDRRPTKPKADARGEGPPGPGKKWQGPRRRSATADRSHHHSDRVQTRMTCTL